MNAHAAASGSGIASMIHLGLGLKCSEYVFSRFRYKLDHAQSQRGGREQCILLVEHPSWVGKEEISYLLSEISDHF